MLSLYPSLASWKSQISNLGTLTHWGRVTHMCVSKITIIGSDNGLAPGRRQAIIWTNDGILLIRPLGTNFSEILSEVHTLSFTIMHLKTSSAKWRPFCLGLNVLTHWGRVVHRCVRKLSHHCFRWWHNGLAPGLRQAITYTMLGYCQLDPLEQNSVTF